MTREAEVGETQPQAEGARGHQELEEAGIGRPAAPGGRQPCRHLHFSPRDPCCPSCRGPPSQVSVSPLAHRGCAGG